MTTTVQIDVEVSEDRLPQLLDILPNGWRTHSSFRSLLREDDRRNQQIVECLASAGYRVWGKGRPMDLLREYTITYIREYEPSDFEHVEYLEFWPEPVDSIGHSDRDEQGSLRLERPTLKNARRTGLDFASTILGHILVLQRVRALLGGNLSHLIFRPTTLVTGRGSRPARYTPIPWEKFKVSAPWWELTSDLILPPLSPSMELRDDQGNPIRPGDCSKGCSPREGLYNHAELHYRRSDLAGVEPFDVALTFENFGVRGHTENRATVVSKRFYDDCKSKRLKGRWAAVRIDDG